MSNPFRYFNSSPEVIRLVVMMYACADQLCGLLLQAILQRLASAHADDRFSPYVGI